MGGCFGETDLMRGGVEAGHCGHTQALLIVKVSRRDAKVTLQLQ